MVGRYFLADEVAAGWRGVMYVYFRNPDAIKLKVQVAKRFKSPQRLNISKLSCSYTVVSRQQYRNTYSTFIQR